MLALLQDLEGLQLTTSLLEVVLAFAHTIEGLSHLPGALDILDPNIHAAARNFVAMSAASTAQPPLASTHDINNENFSNSDVNLNMKGPKLTKLHARVSSAGPAANTQAVLSPAGNAAASMPAQQANPSAPGTPVSSFRPNMAFNSLTEDYFNMGPAPFSMGPALFSAKVPRSKRLCTDLFKAQRARACDNAQNTHGMVSMASATCLLVGLRLCVSASHTSWSHTHGQHSPCKARINTQPAGQHSHYQLLSAGPKDVQHTALLHCAHHMLSTVRPAAPDGPLLLHKRHVGRG